MDVQDAILKDGVLYCSCGKVLNGCTKDHNVVIVNGESYIQFIKFCTGKCSNLSHYEVDITVDSRELFVFPQEVIQKVKEEVKKEYKEAE